MQQLTLILLIIISSYTYSLASHCFIAKHKTQIIQEGDCAKRYAPCSTFKIPLSLMGFDAGILIDELHPVWQFKEGYADWLEAWRQDQTPQSWLKTSCVWYSQILTVHLGVKKFQEYVTKFSYGNQDISGDKGKKNGLTNAWLSSSLEISSLEQIEFLEKLLTSSLPVSPNAHSMTKQILFIEDLKDGWKLYGKTGNGFLLNSQRTKKSQIQHGWFIGWIEKDNETIIFAHHITDIKKEETFASLRAKSAAKEKLIRMIDQKEDKQK